MLACLFRVGSSWEKLPCSCAVKQLDFNLGRVAWKLSVQLDPARAFPGAAVMGMDKLVPSCFLGAAYGHRDPGQGVWTQASLDTAVQSDSRAIGGVIGVLV